MDRCCVFLGISLSRAPMLPSWSRCWPLCGGIVAEGWAKLLSPVEIASEGCRKLVKQTGQRSRSGAAIRALECNSQPKYGIRKIQNVWISGKESSVEVWKH